MERRVRNVAFVKGVIAACSALALAVMLVCGASTASAGLMPPPGGVAPDPGGVMGCPTTTCATWTFKGEMNGSGTVVSTPAGINCTVTKGVPSGVCSYVFKTDATRVSVTFVYTPSPGSRVRRLSGPLSVSYTTEPYSVTQGFSFGTDNGGVRFEPPTSSL